MNFMSYLVPFQGMYFDIIKSSLYDEKWGNSNLDYYAIFFLRNNW